MSKRKDKKKIIQVKRDTWSVMKYKKKEDKNEQKQSEVQSESEEV